MTTRSCRPSKARSRRCTRPCNATWCRACCRMTAPDVRKAFENPGKNEDGVDAPVYDPNAAQPVALPPLADAVHHRRAAVALGVHGTTLDADRLAEHLQRAGNRLAPMYTVSGDEPARHRGRGRAARLGARRRRAAVHGDGRPQRLEFGAGGHAKRVAVPATAASSKSRSPRASPARAGADTLARLAEQAEEPVRRHAGADFPARLDKATRESRWVQALARSG